MAAGRLEGYLRRRVGVCLGDGESEGEDAACEERREVRLVWVLKEVWRIGDSLTLVGGAVWPAEDGCEVEDVVVAGGLEAEEGGRRVFVVLVELFDQAFGCHGVCICFRYISTLNQWVFPKDYCGWYSYQLPDSRSHRLAVSGIQVPRLLQG